MATLAALVATAAIAGCGSPLPPPQGYGLRNPGYLRNISQVEHAIADVVRVKERLGGSRVYCPDEVPALTGEVFACVVYLTDARPQLFRVTEVNPVGGVTFVRTR